MPYKSKAQARWANATRQPFRQEWNEKTQRAKGGFKRLPERVGQRGKGKSRGSQK